MNFNKKIFLTVLLVLLVFLIGTSGLMNGKKAIADSYIKESALNLPTKLKVKQVNIIEYNNNEASYSQNSHQIEKVITSTLRTIPSAELEKPVLIKDSNIQENIQISKPVKKNVAFQKSSKYVKLVSFERVNSTKKCQNGYRIDEGLDTNKNEKLEKSEIYSTKVVCEDEIKDQLAVINPKADDYFEVKVAKDINKDGKLDNKELVIKK